MRILAIDIGSSSVKAGLFQNSRLLQPPCREPFPTAFGDGRAEVSPQRLMIAIRRAAASLRAGKADFVVLAGMSPSWLAMDKAGRALTPIITHQDRRSLQQAREFLAEFGQRRLLQTTGNIPCPGGISATTSRWMTRHQRSIMRKCDLAGHVTTWLLRRFTGARVIDPSNASFTGIYKTVTLGGWDEALARFAGLSLSQLPELRDGGETAGALSGAGARVLGLQAGTPVLTGIMDTSAALLAAGAAPGQMVNASGTTDVLALCVDHPRPHPRLLTRAVGTGKLWVQVSTIASAGSTLQWLQRTLFSEMDEHRFYRLVQRQIARPPQTAELTFDPYLAGDRMALEQPQAVFRGLTLATTREQMLYAAIDSLARASAARLDLLAQTGTRPRPSVLLTGGSGNVLAKVLHRDWPGAWRFRQIHEANLHGLASLAMGAST
jgi:xylulokinase